LKFLKNRKFQIALVVLILLIVAVLSINRYSKVNIIRNIVTIPVSWVQKKINGIEEYFKERNITRIQYSELLEKSKELELENQILKEKNAALSLLDEENQLLREAIKLKNIFEGYDILGANIMGADPGNHIYRYKIDVGEKDQVKFDLPVLAANNTLYGRVHSMTYTTSIIVPIIDETMGISGWISKPEGGHVNIVGDIRYKEAGKCLITNIADNVIIEVGDVVETSGFGGIYPKGIFVGIIVEVFNDETTNEQFGVLEPYVDFYSIDKVFLLMEKEQ